MIEPESSCVEERIVRAVQSIRDSLVCSICLEIFKEPVTIKCGHKFCQCCILKVAKNENAACPCCNVKIHKRTIPKEGNKFLQSCADKYVALVQAISDDSGIDTTQPFTKVKHTKESVINDEKLNTSKYELTSVASFCSTTVVKNQSGKSKTTIQNPLKHKRLTLRRPPSNESIKSFSSPKNTLHKYLSNNKNETDQIQCEEKVKSWLKDVSPTLQTVDSDQEVIPSCSKNYKDISNVQKSPVVFTSQEDASNIERSPLVQLVDDYETSIPKTSDIECDTTQNSNQETSERFKETQKRMQEVENMARKKKLTPNFSENFVKTQTTVPALSHSDADDWIRVKKVGKEMRVKTFKSLHVSKEKNSSYVTANDTEPSNSVTHSKNVSKESEVYQSPRECNSTESKKKKILKNVTSHTKEDSDAVIQDYKHQSIDSSFVEQNMSLTCMDESKLNEIIGIESKQKVSSLSKKMSKSDLTSNNKSPSLLGAKLDDSNQENENFKSKVSSAKTSCDVTNSPTKPKLSLKLKISPSSSNSRKTSRISTNKSIDSPVPSTPERPKSRLSLRLPHKNGASPVKQVQSPIKQIKPPLKSSTPVKSQKKNYESSNSRYISFKKLGKFTKKKRSIPFLYLGQMNPKTSLNNYSTDKSLTNITIKSIVPVHYDLTSMKKSPNPRRLTESIHQGVKLLSPEKDSQLKYLALDSPDRKTSENNAQSGLKTNTLNYEEKPPSEVMEIDEPIIEKPKSHKQLLMEDSNTQSKDVIKNSQDSQSDAKSDMSKSSANTNNTVKHRMNVVAVVHASKGSYQSDKEILQLPNLNSSDDLSEKDVILPTIQEKVPEAEDDVVLSGSSEDEQNKIERSSSPKKLSNDYANEIVIDKSERILTEKDLLVYELPKKILETEESSTGSLSSSPIKVSSKKKRPHIESSNDDDDDLDDNVNSIIGKWTDPKPATKKAKVSSSIQVITNHLTDEIINVEDNEPPMYSLRPDPAIDDIIRQVKADKNLADPGSSKLNLMPSSLQSADLFETNEHSVTMMQVNADKPTELPIGNSSFADSSPSKNSDKENLRESGVQDITLLDKKQFQKTKSNASGDSDESNKENDEAVQESTPKNRDQYHVRESLLNITQDQLDLKGFERALLGIDKSNQQVEVSKDEEIITATPARKIKDEEDFDSDNIDATPVVKKRQFNIPAAKSTPIDPESLPTLSPEQHLNLIPAVTPVRNRRSYPLCHSTPMTFNSPKKEPLRARNITVVCSSLSADNIKVVHNFVKKFNAKFMNNFTTDVTHVIVHTDPTTKVAQKTSKYIMGIAFRKYVVSYQWVLDCLKHETLLDENDEKFDVLDPDTLEQGSKKSRDRTRNIFDGFAFYCVQPFTSIPIDDFKNVLRFNGGVVASNVADLSQQKLIKVIVLESEDLSQKEIAPLKRSGGILVSFEWIVDAISQYRILGFTPYLFETTIEEALAVGVPSELLSCDENEEEDCE